jgi:hypothetical protein
VLRRNLALCAFALSPAIYGAVKRELERVRHPLAANINGGAPPELTVLQPTNNLIVKPQQPIAVTGLASDRGMPEPREIDSVTVRVDNGVPIDAALTRVPDQQLTTVHFNASIEDMADEGTHTVTVTATNDQGISVTKTIVVVVGAPTCVYPRSNQTRRTIVEELHAIAANRDRCSSVYLDTRESHSNDFLSTEGEEHHQGLARTHQLSDGSIYFFLSHSETDSGDKGNLMQFRYSGPTDGEHVATTSPLTVAPLVQLLEIEEQHPCDMVFLPDINNADAGYLFVAEQNTHNLSIYHWAPSSPFVFQGAIAQETPPGGPNFVFLDRVDDRYYLGIAYVDDDSALVKLFSAEASILFGECVAGGMNVAAFQPISPESTFPFPVSKDAQQVHLIRDASGKWFLLAFRSDPPDKEDATDYVDVHAVEFSPFSITPKFDTVHVFFKPGDTSFASTGTHYVEKSGRLLISSSYRWSEDEGPGGTSYVSRVDECPS